MSNPIQTFFFDSPWWLTSSSARDSEKAAKLPKEPSISEEDSGKSEKRTNNLTWPHRSYDSKRPQNVILIIRDGASFSIDEAARQIYGEPLHVDPYLRGAVRTTPFFIAGDITQTNQNITDSAAAATAYACGLTTFNGYIGMDPNDQPCETLFDLAESRGMTTGVVSNLPLHHATPAAFITHGTKRYDYSGLAAGILSSGLDYYLGVGGKEFYTAQLRDDRRDIFGEFNSVGYEVITDPNEFRRQTQNREFLKDLFVVMGPESMPPYPVDGPSEKPGSGSIPDWSELFLSSIEVMLGMQSKNGFFLVIEEGQIDYAAHAYDLATAAKRVHESDDAIGKYMEQILSDRRLRNTLVVMTSDHGTGGFSIGSKGRFDWNPSFLSGVDASVWWMTAQFKAGGHSIEDLLQAHASITELTDEERAMIMPLSPSSDEWEIARTLGMIITHRSGAEIGTEEHNGDPVPLYAFGPGAGNFNGVITNTEVHDILKSYIEKK